MYIGNFLTFTRVQRYFAETFLNNLQTFINSCFHLDAQFMCKKYLPWVSGFDCVATSFDDAGGMSR